jgi:hypothetical protein
MGEVQERHRQPLGHDFASSSQGDAQQQGAAPFGDRTSYLARGQRRRRRLIGSVMHDCLPKSFKEKVLEKRFLE